MKSQSPLQFFSSKTMLLAITPSVFFYLNASPNPFPAIQQTQTFMGLTSPHMLQLHTLMKRSGVQLISLQQYQYWDWSAVSAEFWVKNNITMTMTVLLWTS